MKLNNRIVVCILAFLCTFMFLSGCGNVTASISSISSVNNDDNYSLEEYMLEEYGAIPWDKVKEYGDGEDIIVYGTVESASYASDSKGKPTFLNIGNAYPNTNRFQVIIWGENRSNFSDTPETYYLGEMVLVSGELEYYNGIPEIEISSPKAIKIVE